MRPAISEHTDENVRRFVIEHLVAAEGAATKAPATVRDDDLIGAGGLAVSSLRLLHVFVQLEESFGFTFDDAAVANSQFSSVGDLVTFVCEAIRQRRNTER